MIFFGIVLLILLAAVLAFAYIYLAKALLRYSFFSSRSKAVRVCVCLLPLIVGISAYLLGFGMVNVLIVFLHLAVFTALGDLVLLLSRKLTKRAFKSTLAVSLGLVVTVAYLGMGWFFAHEVFKTEYQITTDKDVGDGIRIALIADAHLSTTLDGEAFASELDRIEAEKPDILVITGDFVDDDSTREDMLAACQALGAIDTDFGVYFVFGNHDKGYFDGRDFSGEDLVDALETNGVLVLEDETVLVDDRFYVVGRKDRSSRDREDISTLVSDLDSEKYTVVLDHQPNDSYASASAGADIVLSGHTHGGHIFPAGIIGVLMGSNDFAYGHHTIDDTDFIVTSGISGWSIPFKTGAVSEYVIIDVQTK